MEQNQTLGRGELSFSLFKPGTKTPAGFMYFGDTSEFNLNVQSESLPYFSMERGKKVKTKSADLQTEMAGTFACTNISLPNLALWFLGSSGTVTQAPAAAQSETFEAIKLGASYQIGDSDATPMGVRNVTINTITAGEGPYVPAAEAEGAITISGGVPTAADTVTIGSRTYTFVAAAPAGDEVLIGANADETATNLITVLTGGQAGTAAHAHVNAATGGSGVVDLSAKVAGTAGNAIVLTEDADNLTVSGTGTLSGGAAASGAIPLVAGTDYTLDATRGVITFLKDAVNLTEGADVDISDFDIAATTYDRAISGSDIIEGALRFDAYNAEGDDIDYRMAWVKISPNGDLPLKGDNWMSLTWNVEILKLGAREMIYANGQPYTAS